MAEDLSSLDKARGEQQAKGHVIYEGKSGHILSYDRKHLAFLFCLILVFLHQEYKIGLFYPQQLWRTPGKALKAPEQAMS